jgi:hypothetical protein
MKLKTKEDETLILTSNERLMLRDAMLIAAQYKRSMTMDEFRMMHKKEVVQHAIEVLEDYKGN